MEQKVQLLTKIVDNVEKVIVGKREEIEMVLVALMCGSHVLIAVSYTHLDVYKRQDRHRLRH